MDLTPTLLEPKTVVLLDPTAEQGESALDLLEPSDRHVSLVVLMHGPASAALHEYAECEEIELMAAAEIYLDQVARRIARPDRTIEHVVAPGPDPHFEVRCVAAADEVARVLMPESTEPIAGATSAARPVNSGSPRPRVPLRPRATSAFAATPLASRLPPSELRCLERNGTVVTVPRGSTLIGRGEPGRQCLVVIDGELEVRRDGIVLAALGAGAIAGEMSLLIGRACNADVITTNESAVFAMGRSEFTTVINSCPVMAGHVLRTAARRLAAAA